MQLLIGFLTPLVLVGAVVYLVLQIRTSTISRRNEALQLVSAQMVLGCRILRPVWK